MGRSNFYFIFAKTSFEQSPGQTLMTKNKCAAIFNAFESFFPGLACCSDLFKPLYFARVLVDQILTLALLSNL
jgi:hypothetical protein